MSDDILVVDDDHDALRVLVDLLKFHGFHVRAASSGRQALIAASATKPDLMLLDVTMPEADGFAVLERLVQDPVLRDVPVIMLSGSGTTPYKVMGLDLGAADYVEKPYDTRELLARIRTHLRLARDRGARSELLGTTLPVLLHQFGVVDDDALKAARLASGLAGDLGVHEEAWKLGLCVLIQEAGIGKDPDFLARLPGLAEVGQLLCTGEIEGAEAPASQAIQREILRAVGFLRSGTAAGLAEESLPDLAAAGFHPELLRALRRRCVPAPESTA